MVFNYIVEGYSTSTNIEVTVNSCDDNRYSYKCLYSVSRTDKKSFDAISGTVIDSSCKDNKTNITGTHKSSSWSSKYFGCIVYYNEIYSIQNVQLLQPTTSIEHFDNRFIIKKVHL